MGEVMIAPWVRPESPETIRTIDDATVAFSPAFGRGMTQRGIFADPRWGLRRRYRGLRSDEKAAILYALNESRGQFNIMRVTPHAPLRGSFPVSELLTNNSFASSTTGWEGFSSSSGNTISVADRTLRIMATQNGACGANITSSISLTQGVPYVARSMVSQGRGRLGASVVVGTTKGASTAGASSSGAAYGLLDASFVPSATASYFLYSGGDTAFSAVGAGDYLSISYTSLARCALIDNGPNLVTRSDEFDNAAWTKNRCSAAATEVSPLGVAGGAEKLTEDATASNSHFIEQAVTVVSTALDYSYCVPLKAGTRTWAAVSMQEGTGGTSVTAFFNLSTGVVGTTSVGANWANLRTFVVNLGNGWFSCYVVARKTNAAISIGARVFMASADNTLSYSGDGASFIRIYEATLAQSGVPTRLVQTVASALTTGTEQTGAGLYTKGWPVSTSGLLLVGDWIEINGELKQLTAPVNSDAAGLAYMQFRPGLAGAVVDNDPIVVQEPFGRFIYPGTREFENLFGIYGDCEMNLEEIYS